MLSKFLGVKTDNANIEKKADIRKSLVNDIATSRVLEVYCGSGVMHDMLWHEAMDYVGIDKLKFFDSRKTICGDAEKALSLIDVNDFNVFDIDAYGSPYEVLDAITRKYTLSGGVSFIITDGIQIDLRMGKICAGLRRFIDFKGKRLRNAHMMHDDYIQKIVDLCANRLQGRVVSSRFLKGSKGSGMRYYGFRVENGKA